MQSTRRLYLSNGISLEAKAFGYDKEVSGELVFNTAMVSYPDSISDPSYYGQILVFSYPLIGNYGAPSQVSDYKDLLEARLESYKIHLKAIVVSEIFHDYTHWNHFQSLHDWLVKEKVPGIYGLDTRYLVQMLRDEHSLYASISKEKPKSFFRVSDVKAAEFVSCSEKQSFGFGSKKVAVFDYGVKWNIIRELLKYDTRVDLLPYGQFDNLNEYDYFILANGPGDPRVYQDELGFIEEIYQFNKPVLGICLGSQLMALQAGAKVERLAFGHRGHNHPVHLLGTNQAFMTSQNHSYVVKQDSLPKDWQAWFVNANDQSLEGFRHRDKDFYAVQFHPEAAGGPQDTAWILKDFIEKGRIR